MLVRLTLAIIGNLLSNLHMLLRLQNIHLHFQRMYGIYWKASYWMKLT